ncbi:MAG: serine/threonine protein phosphatase [Ruminococcus sp.]|nr:serine/threonine protein phosphatase [Ruminococcus sp.]
MKRKNNKQKTVFSEISASAPQQGGFRLAPHPLTFEEGLYEELRAKVPIIDAAISKIVRLTCGFKLSCDDKSTEQRINDFFATLPVCVSGSSLETFSEIYLDSLLTYGRAFGEILVSSRTHSLSGLYCADCTLYNVRPTENEQGYEIYSILTRERLSTAHPERLLYTAQNPTPKNPSGVSLLRGLPALSSVLMRIYEAVGQNFDRAGNVRYAVTYKPSTENDSAFAKQRAVEIAEQWSDGMAASKAGCIKDFVAVGDVDIKVIGADGIMLDTEIPVRQILEQLIAKLSIPPFLLGLNWSTTERMSSQQADILTSEIDYYRRLLTQAIMKIVRFYCATEGINKRVSVEWDNVNLQDEESLALAALYRAQTAQLEQNLKGVNSYGN